MTDRPNFGTLQTDPESGLPFIVEVGTLKRLYKLPPCGVCGIARYSYQAIITPNCAPACLCHAKPANENIHPADQDGGQGVLTL